MACEQGFEKLANEADAFAAHVVGLPALDQFLVPIRQPIDTAPIDLFLGGQEIRLRGRGPNTFTPFAEIETRNQVDLEAPAFLARTRRHSDVVIGQSLDHMKRYAAVREKSDRIRRGVDVGAEMLVGRFSAADKFHVGQRVVPAILIAGEPGQMIVASPQEPVGLR